MTRGKGFCLMLCLALLLAALSVAFGEAEVSPQTRRLRLGSSMYTIEIDASYIYGEVTEEDAADGQVAYLYSDRLSVDFDVYQRGAASEGETLAEHVARAAEAHDSLDDAVTDGEVNGIPAGWYRAVDTWNGVEYQTVTYLLDDGGDFVEIVFWLDGEDAEAAVQGMIGTLEHENLVPVRLGSSPYWVFCSASFREGGMTSEDVADNQVAYWVSEETRLDFDVYQFGKEGLPERLADYAALEASEYDGVSELVPEAKVNGIPMGWYRTREAYEGVVYDTLTCVLDAGSEYVEVVFWLDGLTAGAEADAILQSLWMEEIDPAEEEEDHIGEAAPAEGALDAEVTEEAFEAQVAGADAMEAALEAEAEAARAGEMEEAGADGGIPPAPADGAATKVVRLGTTPFTIAVPAGFTEGEMTREDIEDDQVAYYYSHETLLDFDVYQFSKDGYPDDLAVYAVEEATGYNDVSELVTDGEINGIPAAWYRTVEAYQDVEFNTLTYILDGGGEYAEVVFWLDGETADAEAEAIIRTLSRDDGAGEAPSDGFPDGNAAAVEPSGDGPDAVDPEAAESAE